MSLLSKTNNSLISLQLFIFLYEIASRDSRIEASEKLSMLSSKYLSVRNGWRKSKEPNSRAF